MFLVQPDIKELLKSHCDLGAALMFAGKRIRQVSRRHEHDPALPVLRTALKEARAVVRKAGEPSH